MIIFIITNFITNGLILGSGLINGQWTVIVSAPINDIYHANIRLVY